MFASQNWSTRASAGSSNRLCDKQVKPAEKCSSPWCLIVIYCICLVVLIFHAVPRAARAPPRLFVPQQSPERYSGKEMFRIKAREERVGLGVWGGRFCSVEKGGLFSVCHFYRGCVSTEREAWHGSVAGWEQREESPVCSPAIAERTCSIEPVQQHRVSSLCKHTWRP